MTLLSVEDLRVVIDRPGHRVHALAGVSMAVEPGEVVGLVGESGGGKSMLARSIVGLLPGAARATGRVLFGGADVLTMDETALRAHRGGGAAICFQNPRGALSPTRTVGRQLTDRLSAHQGLNGGAARKAAIELFEGVGIRSAERRLAAYPHELSGGQAQRVMISLATGCAPGLLIADEPTTGLDVTLTREILRRFRAAADAEGRGVLLISHDLASIAEICDRVVVLNAGRVVESGPAVRVLREPADPYTRALIDAVPDISRPKPTTAREQGEPGAEAVRIEDAHVVYGSRFGSGGHHALRGVSLTVRAGETVGVVGESGSGKSTLARLMLGMIAPTSGRVTLAGRDPARLRGRALRDLRRRAQLVFQDPVGALSPRRTIADAVAEPLRAAGVPAAERGRRVAEALSRMGLPESFLNRRPHELSGGQAQRVGIARALVGAPDLIVFDEPTSALDVTVQAQILKVVGEVAGDAGRGSVFISHDLATVRGTCDRVVVLYLGRIVEEGPVEEVFANPRHPYTMALLAGAPRLSGERAAAPSVELTRDAEEAGPGTGCPLAPRCPFAQDACRTEEQRLTPYGAARVACRRVPEIPELIEQSAT
ncbi:ABC transporter ATP-binding protein [Spongiactinospora sp. TRM90649]|uniref:dipeptide ABC transporter ATP-binding protein n=1 Tax=Spongiactinospora sp. TRM90649 TaxID=3031114 RepID=UPI0023FA007A|nr:ABC transporter ATP-binding protein [Spongiactinospora sp. TRM90649]MDF5754223.1 ABC transporter ATP-binding protein [Spongiactinospora sp. TRM90649]